MTLALDPSLLDYTFPKGVTFENIEKTVRDANDIAADLAAYALYCQGILQQDKTKLPAIEAARLECEHAIQAADAATQAYQKAIDARLHFLQAAANKLNEHPNAAWHYDSSGFSMLEAAKKMQEFFAAVAKSQHLGVVIKAVQGAHADAKQTALEVKEAFLENADSVLARIRSFAVAIKAVPAQINAVVREASVTMEAATLSVSSFLMGRFRAVKNTIASKANNASQKLDESLFRLFDQLEKADNFIREKQAVAMKVVNKVKDDVTDLYGNVAAHTAAVVDTIIDLPENVAASYAENLANLRPPEGEIADESFLITRIPKNRPG